MEEFKPNDQWSPEKNYLASRICKNAYTAFEGVFTRKWDNDRDIAMLIAKNNGYVLKDFNREWFKDREVAIEAVGSNTSSFNLVSEEWKADKNFVLECVKKNIEVGLSRYNTSTSSSIYYIDKAVISNCSQDIQELCKDKDPVQALEAAIRMEKMQAELKPKAPSPKRGLKI